MDDMKTLFDALLTAEDEKDVDAILRQNGLGLENESAWRPLGDMENNFSTVGNQQTEATAALVEKLINGLDAVLMAECFREKLDPEGPNAPRSMAEAVERFFKVKEGLLSNLDAKQRTDLAAKLHLVAVGQKTSPSYLIVDDGEGQTPEAFPDTFMSLNRSNKLRIPFVQGKFNSGGTGVLQFCGELNIQLIVSRRHPDAPIRDGDRSRDMWGFTVVRRMKPTAGRRNSMYVYLAPNNLVPRFNAESIDVLPEDRKSVQPRSYARAIRHGTCVKLYNFRWRAKSIATTEARYELERFLHSPCLPFRLTETREYRANYFSTTIAGVWATVASDDAPEDSKVEPNFPAFSDLNLTGVGLLPYRIAVFRDGVDPRHVPHGVFFTVNGQVHGSLPADFVSRHLKFDYLKDHLLVSIDCTAMEPTVREDFFMASRDRVRKNEVYEEVLDHLKEALREHAGLRQLNAARRKKEIEETLNDDAETRNLFSELLKADPSLASLFGMGDKLATKTGPGPDQPFVGRKFPTYFRLLKNPTGGLVKQFPINQTCRVEFETDATNDYFKRGDCPGVILVEPNNLIEHSTLWNGRFTAQFRMPWNAKPGDRVDVKVSVHDIERDARGEPFTSAFTMVAEREQVRKTKPGPRPEPGGDRNKPGNNAGRLAIPDLKWKAFDDQSLSLVIRNDEKGQPEYFANQSNQFLTAELIKAKDDDKPLVKFWFGYGLLLCALGMMKMQSERDDARRKKEGSRVRERARGDETNGNGTGEELNQLGTACDGLARVIIPIIRTLYRGPQTSAS
jgi:hypothetical protein